MTHVATSDPGSNRTANIDAELYAAGETNDAMNRIPIRAHYFTPAYSRLIREFAQEEPALSIDSKKMCSHHEWQVHAHDTFYLALLQGIRNGVSINKVKIIANFINPDGTVDEDDDDFYEDMQLASDQPNSLQEHNDVETPRFP